MIIDFIHSQQREICFAGWELLGWPLLQLGHGIQLHHGWGPSPV